MKPWIINQLIIVSVFSFLVAHAGSSQGPDDVPTATDLTVLGLQSNRNKIPIMIMYAAETCEYCERLEEDLLGPMHISGNIQLVPVDEVYYFHAEQKYVTVRHVNGEVIIDESLKSLEEEFGERFIRVHRNALVAKAYLDSLEKQASGQWMVKMRGVEESLEVSRRHMTQVRKILKQMKK